MLRKFLSQSLLIFNLQIIKIVNLLNRLIIEKMVNNETVLFNIQYVQYTLIEVLFQNF